MSNEHEVGARPPTQALRDFVDEHRSNFGVESICKVLQIAPSGYRRHAALARDPQKLCMRAKRDEAMMPKIESILWQCRHREDGPRWSLQMHSDASVTNPSSLRQCLLASDPMQRAIGLHALEVVVERCGGHRRSGLLNEPSKFAARGIPYYLPNDPHFTDWIGKAVSYWERLQAV